MSARRLDAAGLAALGLALADPAVMARYAALAVAVPGSECRWDTGAVSGRGHGRFWIAPGRVVITESRRWKVPGRWAIGANNPLCQRIGAGHVVVSIGDGRGLHLPRQARLIGT